MERHGWGRYPRIETEVSLPQAVSECVQTIRAVPPLIGRGLGRSYGDSSLASRVLETTHLDHFLDFNDTTGLLLCEGGVSLDAILRTFVPKGWFLPVTPGTRFITVAGAIASDVHGKNHHLEGTFTTHVRQIRILLGNGEQITASAADHSDLFRATCGGMGLTGIIVAAELRLKRIQSSEIVETTIKAPDLEAVLTAFDDNAKTTYSVAWIDCLARGKKLGRSLLMLGEHAQEGPLAVQKKSSLPVPVELPSQLLNRTTVAFFNALYYGKVRQERRIRTIPFEPFFYPLDTLTNWNRLYGKPGFLQYQCVLPKSAGVGGLRRLLETIAATGRGSFLAVLKVFGEGNGNYLSFPMEGYTLALDFKVEPAAFKLLNALDVQVRDQGGRLYLAKDARMTEATFKRGYPNWKTFEDVRLKYHAIGHFASAQSKRLGLQ